MTNTEKTPNYSAAQEQIIRDYAKQNGNVLNVERARELAANPAMNSVDGTPRKAASIVAKIGRMIGSGETGFTYERKQPVTKTGETPVKKVELVAQIATLANLNVTALDGMEKSPKGALQSLIAALAVSESEAANG